MTKPNDSSKLAIQMLVTSRNCVGDSRTSIAVAKREGKPDERICNS